MLTTKIIPLDVETTTKNKGHPFTPENKLVSYASDNFYYYTDPTFHKALHREFQDSNIIIGFSFKFDLHWSVRAGVVLDKHIKIWDCQLAEFILKGQKGAYGSLNEALESYGIPIKLDVVKSYWDQGIDTDQIPIPILEEYNLDDSAKTLQLYHIQQEILTDKQKNLVLLLGEDLKTLQNAEYNGIKWDAKKATEKIQNYTAQVSDIEQRLVTYLPIINHGIFNWDSGDHLSVLLYGGEINFDYSVSSEETYKSGSNKGTVYVRNKWFVETVQLPRRFNPLENSEVKKTKDIPGVSTRFYQTDGPTLQQLKTRKKEDMELLVLLQTRSDNKKVLEMILSIEKNREKFGWENELLHPQFNQNVAVTGRLSSSQPNMQNSPEEIDELLISRYND